MKMQDLINEVDALEPGQRLGMILYIAGSFSEPELEAIRSAGRERSDMPEKDAMMFRSVAGLAVLSRDIAEEAEGEE